MRQKTQGVYSLVIVQAYRLVYLDTIKIIKSFNLEFLEHKSTSEK